MQAKKARKSARKTAAIKGGASIQVVYGDPLREAMARRLRRIR